MKIYLRILLCFVLFSGCASPMKNFNTNAKGWKPDNFNPKEGILLIQKASVPPFNQQIKIEKYMKASYPYKYAFIEPQDLKEKDSEYKDINIYRWELAFYSDVADVHSGDMNKSSMMVRASDYYFVDRLNGKTYPKSGIASSWPYAVLKRIIEKVIKR